MAQPTSKLPLKLLPSGVPGLDEVFGGGLPEYSFNLIAGPPGAGKTTLIHQLIFANATAARPALYFTVVGEPPMKMLRYQQQMEFFDPSKVGDAIRFVDLTNEVQEGDLDRLLEAILVHLREVGPAMVVVDSFKTIVSTALHSENALQTFLQRLAIHLSGWQATSFLIGEYTDADAGANPVFTIADGIFWLSQNSERNAMARRLQVMKLRGRAAMPGLHTFRITSAGIHVFPRTSWRISNQHPSPISDRRCTLGVPFIDAALGGGLPEGDLTLLAGPSGTGKSLLSGQFIAEGVKHGEPGLLALFEEHPDEYVRRAESLGVPLRQMVADGKIKMLHLHPLDVTAEEILHQLKSGVAEIGARRLVIDSLNGLELALSPAYRDDFRESLYRMVGGLTGSGVSVILTVEVSEGFDDLKFSPHEVSFLSQNIVYLRYVELDGQLRKMFAVVKMRRSEHAPDLIGYRITSRGVEPTGPLHDYQGILSGVPVRKPIPPGGAP